MCLPVVSAEAKNSGNQTGLGVGDTLTIKFDIATNQPSVSTYYAIQRVAVKVDGEFHLQLDYGQIVTETSTIQSTASPSTVQSALESLPNVGYVIVSESSSSTGFMLKSWDVTFVGNTGEVPLLHWKSSENSLSALDVSNVTTGSTIPAVQTITTKSDPGWYIYGVFKLVYEGMETNLIKHDASHEKVKEELEALSTVGLVHVTREDADNKGGVVWSITFVTSRKHDAKVSLLNVTQVSFPAPYTGPGGQVVVEQISPASGRRGVHELVSFSSPVANLFDARWTSPKELELVVGEPLTTLDVANTEVGVLTLAVDPNSGLKRADGAKDATNATVVLTGTW